MKRTLACLALALFSGWAAAQAWPTAKPIRWIVTYSPGSSVDIIARELVQPLGDEIGQRILVENRPGAGGDLATNLVAKAPKDGYTIGFASPAPLTINPVLRQKMPFEPQEIAPISLIATGPNVLLVNPDVPVRTLKEVIALARATPGRMTFASPGMGTSNHLAGELLQKQSGIELVHVPYKGNSEALVDLIAGRVQMMYSGLPPVMSFVAAGKVRAIAVADVHRAALLPDVPTFEESGLSGAESLAWYGLMAPAGVSPEILDRLNAALRKVLQRPEVKTKFAQLGIAPTPQSRAEFSDWITSETTRWRELFRGRKVEID